MTTAPISSTSSAPLSINRPASLGGVISVPGDKSISHRSMILNSIANGEALIQGLSDGQDVLSTMHCLQAMGVSIEPTGITGSYTVKGRGSQLEEPSNILDAGNSGTSMRLLSGILASQSFISIITGDGSLRSRPMQRIVQPLQHMGAQIFGRQNDTLAPLVVRGGSLQGIDYDLPMASAQVKSAIILAGLSATSDTVIHQPALSRDHTERMISAMGGKIEAHGLDLVIHPSDLKAVDITVPGDISSAAFWMVAGLCHPSARILIKGVGLNPSRTGIVDVLTQMGAADSLKLVDERMLDEVPILAVAACFATGDTVIRDATELRVKETDRIYTTVTELTRLGADIKAQEDGMVIRGKGARNSDIVGAECQSHGDHRLAMSMAVAGLIGNGEVIIHGAADASVSYPEFWQHLELLTQELK